MAYNYAAAGMAQGLNEAIKGYLGDSVKFQAGQAAEQSKARLESQKQTEEGQRQIDLKKAEFGLEGQVDEKTAESLVPGSSATITAFKQQNGRYPTTAEAKDFLKQAADKLVDPNDTKHSDTQDKLEKQALDRLSQVRGDASLMRVEHQRDAAGMAYDTLAKARSEKRPLTELEQTDLIGQLWQARTGKAPTDQDMKLLNDKTGKRDFNHVITYLTGNPSLVGSSTDGTLANLTQFVKSTGSKADEQWQAYMGPRLVKPTSLDDSRWQHILMTHRGIPFKEQAETSDKTHGVSQTLEDKKKALRAKLGI